MKIISTYSITYLILLSLFVQLIESAPNPLDELTINVNIGGTDTNDTVKCGVKKKGTQVKSESSRIVGGNETEVNEYPWMARILHWGNPLCGGSIIADKWILTAAHCTKNTGTNPDSLDVVIGEHDITTTTETQITKRVKPDLIIIHPDYIHNRYFGFPDIALFRIPPIDLKTYTPVCLPAPGDDYTGKNAWVYGWGKTEEHKGSTVLMELEVPVWSDTEAKKAWLPFFTLSDEQLAVILFATREGKQTCQGDSGGPLSYSNPNNNGRHEQIGIVSWGIPNCTSQFPGAYTQVSALTSWIYDQIAGNGGPTFGSGY